MNHSIAFVGAGKWFLRLLWSITVQVFISCSNLLCSQRWNIAETPNPPALASSMLEKCFYQTLYPYWDANLNNSESPSAEDSSDCLTQSWRDYTFTIIQSFSQGEILFVDAQYSWTDWARYPAIFLPNLLLPKMAK